MANEVATFYGISFSSFSLKGLPWVMAAINRKEVRWMAFNYYNFHNPTLPGLCLFVLYSRVWQHFPFKSRNSSFVENIEQEKWPNYEAIIKFSLIGHLH
jgi:hypothetical protein